MIRVLSVITTTNRRGAEMFAVDLAAALRERDLGVEVVALTAGGGNDTLPVDVLGPTRRSPTTLRELRRRACAADVVIANGSTTLPMTALALARTDTPFVYRNVGDPRFWASSESRRRRAAIALSRAAAVVTLTETTAYAVRERYGVARERLAVIPKGVPGWRSPATDDVIRRERRAELDLPDGPIVLFLGALSAEKRPDLAVDAVAAMEREAVLVVVGDGPEAGAVRARAATRLPGRHRLVGQVADPSPYLQAADILVLPSDTEGLPGVVMEAGLTGIPVVATDVGGVRDIVLDGATGFVVPPGSAGRIADRLETALTDASRLGANARQHCLANFEIGPISMRWRDLLHTVVG